MTGLLAGARVLDLTNVLAGPFCCYQLAQLGADVIKVEVPGSGDLARQLGADPELNRRGMGASFLAQNAGKRSITINLKSDKGRDVFKTAGRHLRCRGGELSPRRHGAPRSRLCRAQSHQARPHLLRDLGLRPGRAAQVQPGLRSDHPGPVRRDERHRRCRDRARCGSATRWPTRWAASPPPSRSRPRCFDASAAGEGELIDVSMLESTLVAMGWQVSNWLIAGVRPQPLGNENMTASPSGTFRTGDGLLNIAANKQEQFETLVRPDRPQGSDRRSALCRPGGSQAQPLRAQRARSRLRLWRSPRRNGRRLLNQRGVPAGEVLDVPAVLEHAQVERTAIAADLRPTCRTSIVRSAWCARASGWRAATPRRPCPLRRSAPTPPTSSASSAFRSARSTSSHARTPYDW